MLKKILTRKADLPTLLKETIVNIVICWVIYGLVNWESNPMKWDIVTKVFAVFFVCIWCPYNDAKRAILKEEAENKQ